MVFVYRNDNLAILVKPVFELKIFICGHSIAKYENKSAISF